MAQPEKSYERITVKREGRTVSEWERPLFGDLTLKHEGGRTIIEKTGIFGGKTTYMPSSEEAIEAED